MCDTLVSLNGDAVRFAKNSDRDPNEAQALRWHPAAEHAVGETVRCTWSTIPQVQRTHAVVLSRPWWMWGAEMGTNEHGVTIGNEAVFTRRRGGDPTPVDDGGPLIGMDLVRLGLERATTARDAVQVMVELLERHGQGGSCSHEHPRFSYDSSFLIADRSGAFVLETAGRQSAVEDVRGAGRAISNGLSIQDFARHHADPVRGRVAAFARRRARTQPAAENARSTVDLMSALRDHGGRAPSWSRVNGALDAPCAHAGGLVTSTQTTSSWVSELGNRPVHCATGTAAPCLSVFIPFEIHQPEDGEPTDLSNRFDDRSRWWRHELMHRATLGDYPAAVARFAGDLRRLEADALSATSRQEALALVDAAERRWLDDLRSAGLADRRPRWLRTLWRRWDGQAGLTQQEAA